MSASPIARSAVTLSSSSSSSPTSIPTRRININNASDLPSNYSTTPGGTFYSTTPGGTRIVYDRTFLINLRNSPLSRTPPKNMQFNPNNNELKSRERQPSPIAAPAPSVMVTTAPSTTTAGQEAQFEMDL